MSVQRRKTVLIVCVSVCMFVCVRACMQCVHVSVFSVGITAPGQSGIINLSAAAGLPEL